MKAQDINTLADIKEAVKEHIRIALSDNESAHAWEDAVHQRVLWLIAEGRIGREKISEAAALALETKQVSYTRWYA